jgi:FMN-dependent NADH-azoreductase
MIAGLGVSTRRVAVVHRHLRRRLCTADNSAPKTRPRMFSGELKSAWPSQRDGSIQVLCLNVGHENSLVMRAANKFISAIKDDFTETKTLDLWSPDVFRYDLRHVEAKMNVINGRGTDLDKDTLSPVERMATQLTDTDVLVVACPMWNYSIPFPLKQYIDTVIQPGLTFKESDAGPIPLRARRHLVLVTSTGGDYSEGTPMHKLDFQVPYLREIFGLVGFTNVQHVYLKNTASTERGELQATADRQAQDAADAFLE